MRADKCNLFGEDYSIDVDGGGGHFYNAQLKWTCTVSCIGHAWTQHHGSIHVSCRSLTGRKCSKFMVTGETLECKRSGSRTSSWRSCLVSRSAANLIRRWAVRARLCLGVIFIRWSTSHRTPVNAYERTVTPRRVPFLAPRALTHSQDVSKVRCRPLSKGAWSKTFFANPFVSRGYNDRYIYLQSRRLHECVFDTYI